MLLVHIHRVPASPRLRVSYLPALPGGESVKLSRRRRRGAQGLPIFTRSTCETDMKYLLLSPRSGRIIDKVRLGTGRRYGVRRRERLGASARSRRLRDREQCAAGGTNIKPVSSDRSEKHAHSITIKRSPPLVIAILIVILIGRPGARLGLR